MDSAVLGVIVMLPGIVAALAHDQRLKYCGFAVSFLMALAATLGAFR
ncbi:MAG TPA: hypothetical protein VGD46_17040 [Rhizobacter sp.]